MYAPVESRRRREEEEGMTLGAMILAIIAALLLIGALVVLIITLVRVTFTVDSTNCGGSDNTCAVPYKDYLGNCVAGRYKINGASCTDTCGSVGTCATGECSATACVGECSDGLDATCPNITVNSPLFDVYNADKFCEMGGVCTYTAVHDDFISGDFLWLAGNMQALVDKCADLVANVTFQARSCLTTSVYTIPYVQPQSTCNTSTCAQKSITPTVLSNTTLQPHCVWTFKCSRHVYEPGSLSDSLQDPTEMASMDQMHKLLQLPWLTGEQKPAWKIACENVRGEGNCEPNSITPEKQTVGMAA